MPPGSPTPHPDNAPFPVRAGAKAVTTVHAAETTTPPEREARFQRLLAEPNLRRLWTTQLFTSAGEALAQIAMPLLVYELTASAQMVGFMSLVLILPRVLLAPI